MQAVSICTKATKKRRTTFKSLASNICAISWQIIDLTIIDLERRQKPRADRRKVVAIEDCRGWWAMGRKFIFKHNRTTNTNICASKQQPTADKSAEAQQAERITYTQKKATIKSQLLTPYNKPSNKLQRNSNGTRTGLERRQKPRADRSKKSGQGNRRFGRLVKNRCQTCLNRYFLNNIP